MIVSPTPAPRISAVGLISWDTMLVLDRYPSLGSWAMVIDSVECVGGTTANISAAAARLGASVSLHGRVGDDATGERICAALAAHAIDLSGVLPSAGQRTDGSTVLVDSRIGERSIIWHKGAHISRGDTLDIDHLFSADIVVIDTDDLPLRRFLTDLPAHTYPNVRLLGPLTFLSDSDAPDKVQIALRHDVVVGNEREYRELTGLEDSDAALDWVRSRLLGSNCRLLVMTRGENGSVAATHDGVTVVPGYPVATVDTTGAGDAFAGALAYGLANRLPVDHLLRLANAVAALSTTALGSQSVLPDRETALALAGLSTETV